ncbi:hypothetical protein EST38_g9948 [Candolleomyces aberdarensis]|uniref:Uncharacterized protein n=1 Tax=Candolleomyces aberdarensis TaxID=2316362 RepID=A0A4Q2DBY2_9AGAR|nr:hypothetical protein EST38_g9948 [Candolleomyces aberdarensis]
MSSLFKVTLGLDDIPPPINPGSGDAQSMDDEASMSDAESDDSSFVPDSDDEEEDSCSEELVTEEESSLDESASEDSFIDDDLQYLMARKHSRRKVHLRVSSESSGTNSPELDSGSNLTDGWCVDDQPEVVEGSLGEEKEQNKKVELYLTVSKTAEVPRERILIADATWKAVRNERLGPITPVGNDFRSVALV